jgi:hypothetical protein
MENDKLVTPEGTEIEDRLKSFVERTAGDTKPCSLCSPFETNTPRTSPRKLMVYDFPTATCEHVEHAYGMEGGRNANGS